jgi:hypothetical protein
MPSSKQPACPEMPISAVGCHAATTARDRVRHAVVLMPRARRPRHLALVFVARRPIADEQTRAVEHCERAGNRLRLDTRRNERLAQLPVDAESGRAGTVDHDALICELCAARAHRAQHARERDGAGALDVVIKGEHA